MHHKGQPPDDHKKFQEMAALAQAKELSGREQIELARHLQKCDPCRAIYNEYSVISADGMIFLAAAYGNASESEPWNERSTRNRLLSSARRQNGWSGTANVSTDPAIPRFAPNLVPRLSHPAQPFSAWVARHRKLVMPVAACLVFGVTIAAYHLGGLRHQILPVSSPVTSNVPAQLQQLASEKKTSEDLFAAQTSRMSQLQKQIAGDQRDLASLRVALRTTEERAASLSAASNKGETELRQVSQERDALAAEVRDGEKAYQLLQAEVTNLRTEHDRVQLHTAALESKIDELSNTARDQERRLKDDEQYLSSDRDIRELMGARKLYIADVFDVDSGSHTRKAYGRVFYTQNKSLIFYAFDLDREPGVKNASAFQVWGQKDAELGPKSHPMNLGILYMDSESNRRWVLRWDDPKQLAELDAVFVTVEPHGGSQKPTGKPFLYALLRKEANHP